MLEFLSRLFAARPLEQLLRDVVNIVIVAWVIYRALLVLRGTRAIQMAVGLGIVLLVYVGANFLKLATLRGVLSSLLSSIVLIVVVVFQNDIRRALIRMGNTSWFSGGREQQSRVIDEVVAAATELARHRMGALIAFEQDANVLEFAKSEGIHLDSVVTRELLVSLFVPESVNKLHDGAILIRDLRIARAGVFFPMPDTKVLDAQLGSRHRAALGITEETDAVVVVVSEERGTISFCFSGNIVSNLDGQSLRHALLGLFGRTARKKRLAAGKKGPAASTSAPQIRPPAPQAGPSATPTKAPPPPSPATAGLGPSRSSTTLMSGPAPAPATTPMSDTPMPPSRTSASLALAVKAITPAPGKLMASSTPMRPSGDGRRNPDAPPPLGEAAFGHLRAATSDRELPRDQDRGDEAPPRRGRRASRRGRAVSIKGGIRDQIRAAFVENMALKILSLACAMALYAFTHGSELAQRAFSVSVLSILPPNAAKRQLISQLPTEVRITLRGPRTQLDDLHADDIGALQLDLRSGKDGKIDIDEKMFRIPAGLTVEQIAPSSIEVKWDDVIARSIPVQVPRTGEPAPGTVVRGLVVTDPAEIQLRGPRTLVDGIKSARAAPFDVTGLGQGVHTLKLPLDKPPSLTSYDVDQVNASVDIARQLVTKTFSRLKVEVIGIPRATTRPGTVSVVVTGTAEDVNAISPDAVVPRVEPKAAGDDIAKPGNDNLPVLVDVPKGVSVQVDPPKVVVTW